MPIYIFVVGIKTETLRKKYNKGSTYFSLFFIS